MEVYITPSPSALIARHPDIRWLCSAPRRARSGYPAFLDIATSAAAATSDPVVSAAVAAAIPTWEELESFGLTAPHQPVVRGAADAFLASYLDASDAALPRYLLDALATAVSGLGASWGAVLGDVRLWDRPSAAFADRLLRESKRTGFHVAFAAPVNVSRWPPLGSSSSIEVLSPAPSTRQATTLLDSGNEAVHVLAMCPQGLPLRTLRRLVGEEVGLDSMVFPGPAEEPWICLPARQWAIARRRVHPRERREIHARIFDAMETTGMGYLLRAPHAIYASDAVRLRQQHVPFVVGLLRVAPAAVLQHVSALLSSGAVSGDADRARLLVTAARLAASLGGAKMLQRAATYCRTALRLQEPSRDRIFTVAELANVHANQRTPVALKAAERWCRSGLAMLPRVDDTQLRAHAEIRLLNILALVAYHAREDARALDLELQAQSLAERAGVRHPDLERWAMPLLRRNTAQLLERRFSDIDAAIALLERNLARPEALSALTYEADAMTLARLHFDRREHHRVVELLSPSYEIQCPVSVDREKELFGRTLLLLSLLALNEAPRAQRQLDVLEPLSRSVDVPAATSLLSTVSRLLVAADSR